MTDLSNIKLFATHPHPCSYLADREATTVFIDPETPVDGELYTRLSALGFRRSGSHLYRPQCAGCRACISCRIPVRDFIPSRSQRRCARRNDDLAVELVDSIHTDEHYRLYADYIAGRHSDGDMYPPSWSQYQAFLTSEWGLTHYLEYRLEGRLLGVAVCDRLRDGLSAIYTFFDPAEDKRSLGKLAILSQVAQAKALDLPYVYLGYWIKSCDKMDYKAEYRPLELLISGRWLRLN